MPISRRRPQLQHLIVLLATMTTLSCVDAANPFQRISDFFTVKHGADSLIVTGNYVRPRLLAELVQRRTKDPILLISGNGKDRVFYLSVDREQPLEISRDAYVEFIELLNPRRLVVLGNSEVVPRRVADVLQDRFPTLMITGTNWGVNASAAANVFKYNRLPSDYAYYFRYGTESLTQTAAPPAEKEPAIRELRPYGRPRGERPPRENIRSNPSPQPRQNSAAEDASAIPPSLRSGGADRSWEPAPSPSGSRPRDTSYDSPAEDDAVRMMPPKIEPIN